MEGENKTEQGERVHRVLAHSYLFYVAAVVLGVFLDYLFPIKAFKHESALPFGLVLIGLATILIFWAQKATRDFKKENITRESFSKGPYSYTRMPTNLGLFILVLGFGIITNAFFVILFTIISFVIGKSIFIKKEEEILTRKYGAPYLEYKKSVRF